MNATLLGRALRPSHLFMPIAGLILAALAWSVRAEGAPPGPTAESMETLSAQAFWWADFDELERLYAQASIPGRRTPDGRDLRAAFRAGLFRVFDSVNNDSAAYFAQLVALTREWSVQHPGSSLAQALHARALLAKGLNIRGYDYSSKVTSQRWAGFEQYVQMALAHSGLLAKWEFTQLTSFLFSAVF